MTKKFAEEMKALVESWQSYSLYGDVASARIVDADVKRFMAEHPDLKGDYGTALRLRRTEIRSLENEFARAPSVYENEMDAGQELHKIAMKNQQLCPSLSYSQCLKAAIAENPRLGSQYVGRDIRSDMVQSTQAFFARQHEIRKYEEQGSRTNGQIIANLIVGIPKLEGHKMDIEKILVALNSFGGDTLARAAAERLDVLTRDEIAQSGEPGSEASKPEVMAAIRRRVESRFKELAAVAAGAPINERSLRQLSPQHFK